jgi:hypothetical protein
MKLKSLEAIIAVRELDLEGGGHVTVLIGKPEKFPDSEDYYCPYQIVGIKRSSIRYAGGVDAVQALDLALKMIGADLYTADEAKSGALSWRGGSGEGDLGFIKP